LPTASRRVSSCRSTIVASGSMRAAAASRVFRSTKRSNLARGNAIIAQ
jgi:hypothetical protein